jgi:hypothetical protein
VPEQAELARRDADVAQDRRELPSHIADTARSAMTGLKRGRPDS